MAMLVFASFAPKIYPARVLNAPPVMVGLPRTGPEEEEEEEGEESRELSPISV
jgi:hypothetical protein